MSQLNVTTAGEISLDVTSATSVALTVNPPTEVSLGLIWSSGGLVTIEGITAGGDLSGTYASPTVAKIRNIAVTAGTPANLDLLSYDSTTTSWVPRTIALSGVAAASHTHAASDITTGTISTTRLGSGVSNGSNFYVVIKLGQHQHLSSPKMESDHSSWQTMLSILAQLLHSQSRVQRSLHQQLIQPPS